MQIWHWFRIDSLAVNAQRRKLCGRIGRLISGYIRALPGSNIEQFKTGVDESSKLIQVSDVLFNTEESETALTVSNPYLFYILMQLVLNRDKLK